MDICRREQANMRICIVVILINSPSWGQPWPHPSSMTRYRIQSIDLRQTTISTTPTRCLSLHISRPWASTADASLTKYEDGGSSWPRATFSVCAAQNDACPRRWLHTPPSPLLPVTPCLAWTVRFLIFQGPGGRVFKWNPGRMRLLARLLPSKMA